MDENLEFTAVTDAVKLGPPSLRAISGREAPAVWVKRLAIYKAWPPSPETLLRELELRRGLNIIWANPVGKNPDTSRLSGHGAGKSSFCRLLRYVLDDGSPGTEQFRQGFQASLGIGWALAEVYVGGQVWLVGRPITDNAAGQHSFAYLGGSLQQEFPERPPRVGYTEYKAALEVAVFGTMQIRTLPGSQKQLDWPQLIQWLTRDQEAHFRGLLEWRDNDSDSGSVTISADDRASLVRLVLGLVQEKEQELLKQHAAKSAEHEAKIRERAKLEFAIERDREALATAIGRPVGDPKDSVLQLEISNHVTNLRNQADTSVRAARQDEGNAALVDAVAQAQAQYEIVSVFADEIKGHVEITEGRLNGVTPPARPKNQQSELVRSFTTFVPFADVCSHPMDDARDAKCPLARARPEDPALSQATDAAERQAAGLKAELVRLRGELSRRLSIAAEKKRALDSAQALLNAARRSQLTELENLKAPARNAAMIEALHHSFAKGCADLETLNAGLKDLNSDKETLSAVLMTLTKQHAELMERFTRLFHHISQHMLAKAITGRVVFAGKAIEPRLSYEGEDRYSAALKVTKWVAFDLAALALGMTTEEAFHPRFLLHDSPRESDMAPIIYGGLFHAARELEADYGEKAPFQYIVTTTEPPPDEFGKLPWLRLELDASSKEGRFLKVNI
jgi:hypothetical protein